MADHTENNTGRTKKGQFAPGNPGGPGGPRRRSAMRQAIENAITPAHVDALIKKATHMALQGNPKAMQIVLDRVVGRPRESRLEPEAIDVVLPELNTIAACGDAASQVSAGIKDGIVNNETAKILLETIHTKMQALRETQAQRDATQAGAPPHRPVPVKVLRIWFVRFKATGELPEDEHDAAAVIEKMRGGYDVPKDQADNSILSRDGFILRQRVADEATDVLLDEAVHAREPVRSMARQLLRAFASIGTDMASPFLNKFEAPEFGSMAMFLVGYEERLTKRPYKKAAERIFKRADVWRRKTPRDQAANAEWMARLRDACVCFESTGERPDNETLLEGVLVVGAVAMLQAAWAGNDASKVIPLFDATGSDDEAERERAICHLQDLAKTGWFQEPWPERVPRRPSKRAPRRKVIKAKRLPKPASIAAGATPSPPPAADPPRPGGCTPEP